MALDPTDVIKTIVEAGKASVDFLAFVLIAVLGAGLLGSGQELIETIAFVICMAVVWVGCRYALLRVQSYEKLRDLREHASIEARKGIEKHATEDELKRLFPREPGGHDGQ